MYLAAMFLLLSPSLLCASVLSFCVLFPSVSKNKNCIRNCRGPDTPGTRARHSSKTHFQTNITSAFSLSHLSCGIRYVPQIKPRRHTSARTPWTTTSKPQSASPHSVHVLFLLPCPSCTPTRTPPLLSLLSTDQGSGCSVSISHVSFLPGPTDSDLGSGTAQQPFPLPTGAWVFWLTLPLISVKSDTRWRWSSHRLSGSLLFLLLPAHTSECPDSVHAHIHTHTGAHACMEKKHTSNFNLAGEAGNSWQYKMYRKCTLTEAVYGKFLKAFQFADKHRCLYSDLYVKAH